MAAQRLEPFATHSNLDKDRGRESFSWETVKQRFRGFSENKINMAYECVDRHVEEGRGEKTALHYIKDGDEQQISY
jgi:acetyl-CoA synthetase